jgi:hypothetical protein
VEPVVSLVFAGDTVLDDAPGDLIVRGVDPFAEFADVFARADIRMATRTSPFGRIRGCCPW